jgi:hypothetical protein
MLTGIERNGAALRRRIFAGDAGEFFLFPFLCPL